MLIRSSNGNLIVDAVSYKICGSCGKYFIDVYDTLGHSWTVGEYCSLEEARFVLDSIQAELEKPKEDGKSKVFQFPKKVLCSK